VALVASQLPWLYVALQQFRTGAAPLGAWNVVVAGILCFLAWGLWRRDARSYGPAQVAAWYDLLFSAFYAHSQEAPYLWPSAGLGLLATFAISAARDAVPGARPARAAQGESVPLGPWVKENIEAIVVAFIMALVIRCFCIEVFKIPSSSMEPTLLGDVGDNHSVGPGGCPFAGYHGRERGGDRIMVTKYYYAFTPIERFDVVVFKFPLNQAKNFIKRVVGLPDEEIKIYHGNLYVRKPGEKEFRIVRRTPRTQDSIWIDPAGGVPMLSNMPTFQEYWEEAPLPERDSRASYQLHDSELITQQNEKGQRGARFLYKMIEKPIRQDGQEVGELQISFEFELTHPKGEVFAEIWNEHGRFEARLSTESPGELVFQKYGGDRTSSPPLKAPRLTLDRRYKFSLSVYDGKAVVRVEGQEVGEVEYITVREKVAEDPNPERRVAFGARDATFRVRNLRVGRDIYYQGRDERLHGLREDEAFRIEPGKYVMMGDNVQNSHDSRAWTLREFKLKDGRTVSCESQDVGVKSRELQERLVQRYGLPRDPDLFIEYDKNGDQWALYNSDEDLPPLPPTAKVGVKVQEQESTVPFRQIHEKYIVGKALWIWWPPGRWFRLIR
jgi:signal peptidase I